MSIIGLDPSSVRLPGQPREFKLGTIAESVDRDGFARIYQYCTVSTGTVALGSVCLLSSGGSARALNTSRAAAGSGDASRIGIAVSTIQSGGAGWFQVYGTCRILVDGPTPAATRLYSTNTDGAVANEVSASFISGLATTSPTGAAGTPLGFINWATTVSSTGDGTQGPPGPQGEQGPEGDPGPAGDSAYEVAVNNGFVGTESQWLNSLIGPPGADGVDGSPGGQSAYDIAVSNGFVGTEEEWLDSLQGPPGPQGPAGPGGGADLSSDRWWDDFGAVADGESHPLSSSYATLAEAQVDYPYATSLTQQKDYCAFLTALYGQPGNGTVCVRMREGKNYYLGADTIDPTRRVNLVGYGQGASTITVDDMGPNNLGVPGIRIQDSDAGKSSFSGFTLTTTASGGRFKGGVVLEYSAADGLMVCNDGVRSIENAWFELRNAISPTDNVEGRIQTGIKAPYGFAKEVFIIIGNPSLFTLGESLTVIRGGVPVVAVENIVFRFGKISGFLTDDALVSMVRGEIMTGSVSGATCQYASHWGVSGHHTVQILSAEGTVDSGSFLTNPEYRQIFVHEGTFAEGIEFNEVAYATDVAVTGFGGDAFKVVSGADGRGGNSNRSWIHRCYARNCGGNGFIVAGSDGNVCTFVECNAVNNAAWGFIDRSFLGATFIAGHSALNLTGGYNSSKNTTLIGMYTEGAYGSYPHLTPENRISGDAVSINGQTGVPNTLGVESGARITGKIFRHAHINGDAGGTLSIGYNGDEAVSETPGLRVMSGPVEFQVASFSANNSGGVFAVARLPYSRFNQKDHSWYRNHSGARLTATGGNGKFHALYDVDSNGAIVSIEVLTEGSSYDAFTSAITIVSGGGGTGAVLFPLVGPKKGIIDVIIISGGSGYTGSRLWKKCMAFTTRGISVGAQESAAEAEITTEGPDTNHNLALYPKGTGTVKVPHLKINNGPVVRSGAGSPEGVLAAPVGSMYVRTDGGAGTTLYIKESGTDSTGWVAK